MKKWIHWILVGLLPVSGLWAQQKYIGGNGSFSIQGTVDLNDTESGNNYSQSYLNLHPVFGFINSPTHEHGFSFDFMVARSGNGLVFSSGITSFYKTRSSTFGITAFWRRNRAVFKKLHLFTEFSPGASLNWQTRIYDDGHDNFDEHTFGLNASLRAGLTYPLNHLWRAEVRVGILSGNVGLNKPENNQEYDLDYGLNGALNTPGWFNIGLVYLRPFSTENSGK